MARVALTALLLFALPFVVYALYVAARGRKAALREGVFESAPVRGLIVAGIVAAVSGLISFAVLTQGGPDYQPPVGPRPAVEAPAVRSE